MVAERPRPFAKFPPPPFVYRLPAVAAHPLGMRSLLLGFSVALSAWGAARAGDTADDLTIWWRTQGAEVVGHRTDTGEKACSLVMYHDDDVLLFMWRKAENPSLFIQHPGWRFGDRAGTAKVEIAVGRASSGPGGVATQLPVVDYRDWIRARLDRPIADILPSEREITVDFPNGQAGGVSFPIDRSRMPAVMRGVQRCKAALGGRD